MNNVTKRNILAALIASVVFTVGWSTHALGWTVAANLEQLTAGAACSGPSGLGSTAYPHSFAANTLAHGGSMSCLMSWQTGDTDNVTGASIPAPTNLVEGQEIWSRGYYYFQSPWSWTTPTYIKVMRIHVKTAGGAAHVGYISMLSDTNGHVIENSELASPAYNVDTGRIYDIGSWHSYEMYVKLSSTSGIVRVWKDGVLIVERLNEKTLSSSTDVVTDVLIMTAWNGGAPQNQNEYVDDFAVTSDTPTSTDANGNKMIGTSSISITSAKPSAPMSLSVQ